MSSLNTFRTDPCPVCNTQQVRGFHLGQYCPNEQNHGATSVRETADAGEVFILIPNDGIRVSGEVVSVNCWSLNLEMVLDNIAPFEQAWSARRVPGTTNFELVRWYQTGRRG